jgi:hypothetical protein
VFGNQARNAARYREENQRVADLEVRQQMIGQSFLAIVQAFLSISPGGVAREDRCSREMVPDRIRIRWAAPCHEQAGAG